MSTLDGIVTADAWDTIAPGYDELVTPTANWKVAETALDRLEVGTDTSLLDVACGSGALAIPAAHRGADVLGVDFSPTMVARLEARARAEGLANLRGRVMDGHDLDLDDDTFDVVASQFGVMLFPDQPRGLHEMVRVTKPGGQVLVVGYRPPEEVEFLTFFLGAVQAVVPGFEGPSPDEPMLPFQAADPEVLRRRMEDAGLRDVTVEQDVEPLEFGSGQQMWDWLLSSNPIPGTLTAGLTDAQREQVREVLDRMLRERGGGHLPATITAGLNIAIGRS